MRTDIFPKESIRKHIMLVLLKKFGIDYFIISLFAAIFLAWLYPYFGAHKGICSLSTLANIGVGIIFFFYGLKLNWRKIREGLLNFKMHIVVTMSTFLIFPLLILCTMGILNVIPHSEDIECLQNNISTERITKTTEIYRENGFRNNEKIQSDVNILSSKSPIMTGIWLGIFFLSALPSTVSSSVVMTNLARGNVTAAIFEASISSLLGVFLTPLWMRLFIDANTGGREIGEVLNSLTLQVILPILLGILTNRFWGELAVRNEKSLRKYDQGTIVLIVYVSFCNSFSGKMFQGLSWSTLFLLALGMILLFVVMYGIVWHITHILGFGREDTITALFCGSKKSLVHGATMSRVILSDPTMAGILLLPTMLYHALQLIIVSIIAQRFSKSHN